LLYYKVTILQEANRLSEALEFLEENSTLLPDQLTYMETRADLLFKLGRISDAENVYIRLLDRNHNCVDYMKRIEECKTLCKFVVCHLKVNIFSERRQARGNQATNIEVL
jgi:tetratricopeptide (TPR) repeat protein